MKMFISTKTYPKYGNYNYYYFCIKCLMKSNIRNFKVNIFFSIRCGMVCFLNNNNNNNNSGN